jgi:hypothetical protein
MNGELLSVLEHIEREKPLNKNLKPEGSSRITGVLQ